MAARDRYSTKVTCPNCGQQGELKLSEDDHPYVRNPHRSVDEIKGEFFASVDDGRDVWVTCTPCGHRFLLF